jgi:manganese oxidase
MDDPGPAGEPERRAPMARRLPVRDVASRMLLSLLVLPAASCGRAASADHAMMPAPDAVALPAPGAAPLPAPDAAPVPALATANDNRTAAGTLRDGVLDVALEARVARWHPDLGVDSTVTVQAFAEAGGEPAIPGPLIRVALGTRVRVGVRNTLADSTLVVWGLRGGTVDDDSIHVGPGSSRIVEWTATQAGTFLYWGTTTGSAMRERWGRDSQLTGAIVVDAPGTPADDRIFVMTIIDIYADESRPRTEEDIWEAAINGRSWPHTERLEYGVGDTVRWRWLNGTDRAHPMHLHGFHFTALAKGDGYRDTTYTAATSRLGVTEFMEPGSTFRMEWVPTRAGNWLVHCHMLPHIRPWPERDAAAMAHDLHDVARHPIEGMAGLVLGVTTIERSVPSAPPPEAPRRLLRLLVQQGEAAGDVPPARRFVLQERDDPRPDSAGAPSSTLVLRRDEPVAITVVNRLTEPTSVHWHGMELESYYDGVAGWSGAGTRVAPLIAPGDSFTVHFAPPRAGTYMYHTHMDEGTQLRTGLYAPLLVLEPGETYDPATDLVMLLGELVTDGEFGLGINGRPVAAQDGVIELPPLELRAGARHRFRFINLFPAEPVRLVMNADGTSDWHGHGKDGALLPPALRTRPDGEIRVGVGEALDFEWTPAWPGNALIVVRSNDRERTIRQPLVVR